MKKLFKNIVSKTSIAFFMMFASVVTFAQEAPVQDQDSTKAGYSVGQIAMPNPKSIIDAYTYDPVTNRYIYTASVDGFNIYYPLILTPEEYEKLVRKETMRKYFQEKLNAVDGKRAGSEEARKNLLPRFYVNNKFFEAIFGGNTIDVKPSGSVEIDLGIRLPNRIILPFLQEIEKPWPSILISEFQWVYKEKWEHV